MLHLLNLACIKHTGQPLPSSATDANRWRYLTEDCYELDDNGEVIPKVKKLAILRGVPDIRPCVIHDDPDRAICRQLIVGELKEKINVLEPMKQLKIVFGSIKLTLWVMKQYLSVFPFDPLGIAENAIKIVDGFAKSKIEDLGGGGTNRRNQFLIGLSKALKTYWSQGGYNFHYDYVRFRKLTDFGRGNQARDKFISWIYQRLSLGVKHNDYSCLCLASDTLAEPDFSCDIDVIKTVFRNIAEYDVPHSTTEREYLQSFYNSIKADRMYIGVDKFPDEINLSLRKFHKKFFAEKDGGTGDWDYNRQINHKLMRSKFEAIDEKDARGNSKIFTTYGSVKKTKFATDKYYQLLMISIGSSLNINGAIWGHYSQDRWSLFNQSGRPDWRHKARVLYNSLLSSEEILRVFAPDKKEEKKIIMDKFVASFVK